MLSRKSKMRPAKPTIAIIGDGYCEKIYFEQLKEFKQIRGVSIRPELPDKSGKGGTYRRVIEKARDLLKQGYDKVFCLIDVDTILREGKMVQYQLDKTNLEKLGAVVLENNPCFELWFLLHFRQTAKAFDNCTAVEDAIRKEGFLPDYSKSQTYQRTLYNTLQERLLSHEVPNAKYLEKDREGQSPYYPRCQTYALIEFLEVK